VIRAVLAVVLVVSLAACEGFWVKGRASEHGPNNVRVGVPF
jgi:hypothetical protein